MALFPMTPITMVTGEWITLQAPKARGIGEYLDPARIMPAIGWTDFGGDG